MATLFERIALGSEQKISIHGLFALMREVRRGKATVDNIVSVFNLTAEQETDLNTFASGILASSNPSNTIVMLKDWFYLAEIGIAESTYRDELAFWQRLSDEA